jgi:hypothetical protein
MGAHDLVLSRAGVDCRPVAGDRPAAHARSGYGARVRRNLLLALLLAAVSVGATLAAAEIALRIRHGGLAARPTSGAGPLRMGERSLGLSVGVRSAARLRAARRLARERQRLAAAHERPPGESALRRALRSSFVADRASRLIDPDGWAIPASVRVHRDGGEVWRGVWSTAG